MRLPLLRPSALTKVLNIQSESYTCPASLELVILRGSSANQLTLKGMCRYVDTYHTYTGCKLQERDANTNALTAFARFMRKQGPQENAEHRIKTQTIIQCPAAAANTDLHETHAERTCPNMMPAINNEREVDAGVTRSMGECPVCEAVAEVIRKETDKKQIVSCIAIKRTPFLLNTIDPSVDSRARAAFRAAASSRASATPRAGAASNQPEIRGKVTWKYSATIISSANT